ncbi:MAG: hypothetical protein FJZ43_00095 [Candidatus Staskawiczbacteria bacterium]|nr:hypothetical protein [Candidatus Staskawiczbacteria bacterium]
MWFKYPLIVLILFFATIFQFSLLPYFSIAGYTPNLLFIIFFLVIFFENKGKYETIIFMAFVCSIFLDITTISYFGISFIILLLIFGLEKAFSYLSKSGQEKISIYYFLAIFSLFFILYHLIGYFVSFFFKFDTGFSFSYMVLIGLLYNIIFAGIGFYLYKLVIYKKDTNQLKLL